MLDVDHDADAGQDDDSLFGSPPPSPARGRSPPSLAFPSGSSSTQNVGTLALPGSHLFSELPVTPPAHPSCTAPLSAPRSTQASQPQQIGASQAQQRTRAGARSRSTSCAPSANVDRPRKQKKAKEKTATPRPTPPPIPLPDPSEPPPPNFLRNQQALLGLAGLVSGVNPSQLSIPRHTRGSTPQNPIVVDDTPGPSPYPDLSYYGQPASIARRSSLAPMNSTQLPPQPGEDILSTLAQQRNIFPVVESLLRLLSPSSQRSLYQSYHQHLYPTRTGFERSATGAHQPPPLKRRKLTSVPAGAADWDVPYPFAPGQGPADYQTTWGRERARRLLVDLLGLLKGAAQKAAAKAYYRQEGHVHGMHGGRGVSHYRPETFYYGLSAGSSATPNQTQQAATTSMSSCSTGNPGTSLSGQSTAGTPSYASTSQHIPTPSPRSNLPSMPSFDQLVTSLLSASDSQKPTPSGFQVSASSAGTGESSSNAPLFGDSNAENTPPHFDEWLALLNAFPPGDPNEGSGASAVDPTFEFDSSIFDDLCAASEVASGSTPSSNTVPDNLPPSNVDALFSQSGLENTCTSTTTAEDFTQDFLIDPVLLNDTTGTFVSTPHTSDTQSCPSQPHPAIVDSASVRVNAEMASGDPATPTLVGSPRTSASEYVGPPTPEGDFDWTFGTSGSGAVDAPGESTGAEVSNVEEIVKGKGKEKEVVSAVEFFETDGTASYMDVLFDQAKQDTQSGALFPTSTSTSAPHPVTDSSPPQVSFDSTQVQTPPPPPPAPEPAPARFPSFSLPLHPQLHLPLQPYAPPSSMKAANRASILARGRQLRAALADALERAKVELWETTLEQAVLVHLSRDEK